jgi:CMP-N-acetylneuraminic acid synthetase
MRPSELAQDESRTIDTLLDVVKRLHDDGEVYDAVFILQVTSPLRTVVDIDGAIALLERTGADSVISFTDVGGKHPARMRTIDKGGHVCDPSFAEIIEGMPRQLLPRFYLREGSVYVTRTSVLTEQNSIQGKDCRAWIIPEWRACNIDSKFDFFITEQVLRNYDQFIVQEQAE